jgi:hypothetical protein
VRPVETYLTSLHASLGAGIPDGGLFSSKELKKHGHEANTLFGKLKPARGGRAEGCRSRMPAHGGRAEGCRIENGGNFQQVSTAEGVYGKRGSCRGSPRARRRPEIREAV